MHKSFAASTLLHPCLPLSPQRPSNSPLSSPSHVLICFRVNGLPLQSHNSAHNATLLQPQLPFTVHLSHHLEKITTPTSLHLGNYIGKLKVLIYQDYRSLTGTGHTIFDNDFYDCILHPGRSLDTIYRYIRDNPRRLAIRRARPDFFRSMDALRIAGNTYRDYGNIL